MNSVVLTSLPFPLSYDFLYTVFLHPVPSDCFDCPFLTQCSSFSCSTKIVVYNSVAEYGPFSGHPTFSSYSFYCWLNIFCFKITILLLYYGRKIVLFYVSTVKVYQTFYYNICFNKLNFYQPIVEPRAKLWVTWRLRNTATKKLQVNNCSQVLGFKCRRSLKLD